VHVQTETRTSHSLHELRTVIPAVLDERIQHTYSAAEVASHIDETLDCNKLLFHHQMIHDELDSKSFVTELFISTRIY